MIRMGCRRAYEADLVDFMANAGAPGWAEFRAHYPHCPECSEEVRAWTELHLVLGAASAHPAEERLLRFETARGSLPAGERQAIESHLASCRPCAEELAVLRRFEAAVARPRPPAFLRAVSRVVLHPAFAYALVLALLYPALSGRRHVPEPTAEPVASFARDLMASAKRVAPPPEEKDEPQPTSERRLRARLEPEEQPAAPPVASASRSADAAGEVAAAPAWRRVALREDAVPEVPAAELGPGVELAVPVTRARAAETFRVRVVDAEAGRELAQQFRLTGGERQVEVRVPATWLTPGTYRVVAGPTYSFRVTR